jgi:diadenosine tetraphosphatase ApaH/serine/threonine PP2A family protein phosphatase
VVVNPGSVGLPAYSDDVPHQHYVENGDPRARYCIIAKARSSWSVEQMCVPYDHDAASKMAKDNNRDDWAFWLKTGRAL